ncbi:hypothetical protein BDD12DRAFT_481986 [Trichophaea hybrida]|nr:hypothetical protein BDD12DRAFT_481986 [Trichophaea hybrida]
MSFLGRKKREQPDSSGNEQGHLQGYGGSNVQPALERDGFFPPVPMRSTEEYIDLGASQNPSDGRSMGRVPINHNTNARYNTSRSGNPTITNSSNTVDNSRTYNQAKHNEFIHPTFRGQVRFGDNIYHPSQPDPPMDARMYRVLQKLVQTISWDTLLHHLSVVDQDEYRSTIPPFNWNQPDNFWISKNIDFREWALAIAPRVLLLCAPHNHGMTEVCSHIIHVANEKASWRTSPCCTFSAHLHQMISVQGFSPTHFSTRLSAIQELAWPTLSHCFPQHFGKGTFPTTRTGFQGGRSTRHDNNEHFKCSG